MSFYFLRVGVIYIEIFKLFGSIFVDNSEANKSIDETGKKGEGLSGILGNVGKVAVAGAIAVATAFTGLSIKALQLGGDLEQNLGGSEAVFEDFADTVQDVGSRAFESMGLTQSDFLATANKMGALLKGSGLDIEQSMNLSTQAMQRAADVASIMGVDTSAAMDAVTGAAKGNFTMMDNLGVAMNAVTIESYALSKGIETSYRDMDNATKIGLAMEMFLEKTAYAAGNYAEENETLSGSLKTAGAAFKNFLSGAGSPDAVVKSFSNAADVIVKNMKGLLPRLSAGLVEVVRGLSPQIPILMAELLPPVADGAVVLITGFADAIIDNIPMILNVGKKIASSLITGIGDVIPILKPVTMALSLLSGGLIDILPIAAAFFAIWKGAELLAFIQLSGGVTTAMTAITGATQLMTLAKAKDIIETLTLNALYAKDFIVSLVKATVELGNQAKQFAINTASKATNTIATWSAAAAEEGITLAQYAVNLALTSSSAQWIKSTALKIASTAATVAGTVATSAATAAQWLWNAALSANPIGLAVVAVAGLVAGITTLVKWLGKGKKEQDDLNKSTGDLKNSQEELSDAFGESEKSVESYTKVTTDMFKKISTESEISVQEMIANLRENQQAVQEWSHNLEILARRGIDEGLLQSLKDAGPEAARYVKEIKNSTDIQLQALGNAFAKGGSDSMAGFAQGVGSYNIKGEVKNKTDEIQKEFNDNLGIRSPSKVFMQMGQFVMQGLIEGITGMAGKVSSAVNNVADTIVNSFKNILGIHSPSTVFAGFGENMGQGLIDGVTGMSGAIDKAVDSVFGGLGGDIDYGMNITPKGLGMILGNRDSAGAASGNALSTPMAPTRGVSTSVPGNTYIMQVKMDEIDEVYKLIRTFESFSHNKIVFKGV